MFACDLAVNSLSFPICSRNHLLLGNIHTAWTVWPTHQGVWPTHQVGVYATAHHTRLSHTPEYTTPGWRIHQDTSHQAGVFATTHHTGLVHTPAHQYAPHHTALCGAYTSVHNTKLVGMPQRIKPDRNTSDRVLTPKHTTTRQPHSGFQPVYMKKNKLSCCHRIKLQKYKFQRCYCKFSVIVSSFCS